MEAILNLPPNLPPHDAAELHPVGHRFLPGGRRTSLGGPLQGLAGSTACAFGRQGSERSALYVTTTGGLVTPPGGMLQGAKLIRLQVGEEGYPLSPDERKESL